MPGRRRQEANYARNVLSCYGLRDRSFRGSVPGAGSGRACGADGIGSSPRSAQRRRRSFPRNSLCRPPVGDKRWRPPQPAESWNDTREAKAFGDYCAAAKSTNGPRSEAEDCLFINVWRPSDVSADARLPVYVFIHGGGFINGSSNQADMTEIVEKTGVVGVSFNYRLGALGFFSHPDVTQRFR